MYIPHISRIAIELYERQGTSVNLKYLFSSRIGTAPIEFYPLKPKRTNVINTLTNDASSEAVSLRCILCQYH